MYADNTVVFFAAPEVSTIQATLEKFPSILLFFRRIFPPEVFPFTPLRSCDPQLLYNVIFTRNFHIVVLATRNCNSQLATRYCNSELHDS